MDPAVSANQPRPLGCSDLHWHPLSWTRSTVTEQSRMHLISISPRNMQCSAAQCSSRKSLPIDHPSRSSLAQVRSTVQPPTRPSYRPQQAAVVTAGRREDMFTIRRTQTSPFHSRTRHLSLERPTRLLTVNNHALHSTPFLHCAGLPSTVDVRRSMEHHLFVTSQISQSTVHAPRALLQRKGTPRLAREEGRAHYGTGAEVRCPTRAKKET